MDYLIHDALVKRAGEVDYSNFVFRIPNYIDPPTLKPLIIGVSIGFNIVSLLFLAGRLYSRLWLIKRLALEDHLICFSYILSVFLSFCCIWSTKYGVGLHNWDMPMEMAVLVPKFPGQFVSTIIYPSALTTLKISIILFFLRLGPSPRFRKACFWTIGFVIVIFITTVFPLIFACDPIDAQWDFKKQFNGEAKCIYYIGVWIYTAVMHVLSDLIIFILPIPMIYKSQMRWRKKIHLLVVFGLGVGLLVASVVRLYYNIIMLQPEIYMDYNWHGAIAMAWTLGEVNIGIIVACLPGISPLLTRLFPRFFGALDTGTPPTPDNQFRQMDNSDRESGSGKSRKRISDLDTEFDLEEGEMEESQMKEEAGGGTEGRRSLETIVANNESSEKIIVTTSITVTST